MDASESPARHFIAFISSRASVMSRERVPFAPPAFVADALRARTRARAEMADEEVAHPSSSSSSREMQMQMHAHEDARPPSTDATARDSPREDDEDEPSVSVRARDGEKRRSRWRRFVKRVDARDVVAGLQTAALAALVALLLVTSRAVGGMNLKILSERNRENLDDALESISRAAGRIENVAARAQTVADDVGDVSENNATREDVRQALASAATIVKSIDSVTRDVRDFAGANATREDVRQALASAATVAKSVGSVAGNVSDYARKNATRDDFNDVVRKLGKLIDKGLDQFD
tara:strand:+ start:5580 stop:6458 length:879 start_codon:yes stop_codon:yes gene_type:complete